MDILNCSPEEWYKNEKDWQEVINSENVWDKIPLLNVNELHSFKDLQLVKFRGMVQDMHGPEFYMEKFEVLNEETWKSDTRIGKYRDIIDCKPNETINIEGPNTVRGERMNLVVISVPAVNSWAKKVEEDDFKLPGGPESSTSGQTLQLKRCSEEMEVDPPELEAKDASDAANKRHCTISSKPESTQPSMSQEHLLNFPIPDPTGKVCHLKIYKGSELSLLNAVYEFVGFLSINPSLAAQEPDDFMDEIEFQVHNPPPSLIPRIHCVAFKPMEHNNPLVGEDRMSPQRMQFVKKELLILFTQLLLGDELAAEFLIYHLMSEVYLRKDCMALGKFSLNISNIQHFENHDYCQELYKFIELLVPKSHYLPMTLDNMNTLTFVPKKDYKANRIVTSILQLSPNTHLVLDETKLTPGQLNEGGVNGVRELTNVIKYQKTLFDFTYIKIEFDCNIPCLILSEGKSMLPSDIHIPLNPDDMHLNTFNEILEAARHFLKPDLLNEIRIYLTLARLTKYEISDSIQEMVQEDFVTMRQEGAVSGDDLHNLLVVARLICISQGKTVLDEDCWKRACQLERARKERLKKTTNTSA